jgi:hypothetical protein
VLVRFADAPAIAREVIGLLGDDTRRAAIRRNAYRIGREALLNAHFAPSFVNASSALNSLNIGVSQIPIKTAESIRHLGIRPSDLARLCESMSISDPSNSALVLLSAKSPQPPLLQQFGWKVCEFCAEISLE